MLDDKKIEEAAYRFATSQTHGELLALIDGYKEGYKDAINEFLKDLWHPASEKPVEDKPFLSQEIGRWRVGVNSPLIPNNEWSTQRKIRGIKRWLYVEDLPPKEGGEQ